MEPISMKTANKEEEDQWTRLEITILKHHQKLLKMPCRRACTVMLYLMYSTIEGYRSDDIIRDGLRVVYWLMSVITLVYVDIISVIGYFFTGDSINVPDLMYLLATCAATTYIHTFVQFVTHHNRDELKTIIKYIDNGFPSRRTSKQWRTDLQCRYNSVSIGTKWFVFLAIVYSQIVFLNFFYAILFCDRTSLGDQQLYVYGIPFVSRIHSYKVYFLVYWSSMLLTSWAFFSVWSMVLLDIMIGCEFYNAYSNLGAHFHIVIDDTVSKLKASCGYEVIGETEKSKIFRIFKKEVAVIIEHHQFLTKSIEMLRPFVEIFLAVNLFTFFAMQVPLAYATLIADIPPVLKVKIAGGFVLLCCPLYSSCYFGHLCEEMTKTMSEEVYFSQWYALPAEFRKTIHIFLAQSQEPIKFSAFKMYPLTMNMFSKALNFVYTVVSLQRSTISSK